MDDGRRKTISSEKNPNLFSGAWNWLGGGNRCQKSWKTVRSKPGLEACGWVPWAGLSKTERPTGAVVKAQVGVIVVDSGA